MQGEPDQGRLLEGDRAQIRRLAQFGWKAEQIAEHLGIAVAVVRQSLQQRSRAWTHRAPPSR